MTMRRLGLVLSVAVFAALAVAGGAAADHTNSEEQYVAGSHPLGTDAVLGAAVCQDLSTPTQVNPGNPGVGGACNLDIPAGETVVTMKVIDAYWGQTMAFGWAARDDAGEECGLSGDETAGDGEATDGVATVDVSGTECTHIAVYPDFTGTRGTIVLS
jgi:hypothetical protein